MTKSEAIAAVSREQTRLIQLSDAIWDHPQEIGRASCRERV